MTLSDDCYKIGWNRYLKYLTEGPHSVRLMTSNLSPTKVTMRREKIKVSKLGYTLWPFQKEILSAMGDSTIILGLPTGLGKTYLAGARIHEESKVNTIRVLFLVPSIPLGVQQTLFAREKLGVDAFFISGGIPPERRRKLAVWNKGFVVATPQTFHNDHLAVYMDQLKEARNHEDPTQYLSGVVSEFPFDMVVADECQRYIGETDGYSVLLVAKACSVKILALSATPQLHSFKRLQELKKVFDDIRTFSIDHPAIKEHMPERLLVVEEVETPAKLMRLYHALGSLSREYSYRISRLYRGHHSRSCKSHPLCRARLAIRMLRMRLVEDGASSVEKYQTWRFRDLRNRRRSLNGESIYRLYQNALQECFNKKLEAAVNVLRREVYQKAIVYVESVNAAKELSTRLQGRRGLDEVACLVGKGDMSMDQQTSAMLHFKEQAQTLICTSVGEEGLDIPTADIEIWIDPPSNPQKWIQRFGRILRQPGDKKLARIYALVGSGTHERKKLLHVKEMVEQVYGFTQKLETRRSKLTSRRQKTMADYLRKSS